MISLSYPSNSQRWPNSGLYFNDWDEYSFVLGYLCNIRHYYRDASGNVTLQIEANELNGAYASEGRILYYGLARWLQTNLLPLFNARSEGKANVTFRINCNDYVYSLVNDYAFNTRRRGNNITLDVLPPNNIQNIFNICTSISRTEFSRGYDL